MTGFYIGLIVGLIIGVILGAKVAPDQIINEIGKIKTKGDNSPVEAIQEQTPTETKRKGFFKRLLTKKNEDMKKYLFAFVALSICILSFGQEILPVADVVAPTMFDSVFNWIAENWGSGLVLSVIISTLLSRLVPTEKAKMITDVIGFLIDVYQKVIPNRKKGGGVH